MSYLLQFFIWIHCFIATQTNMLVQIYKIKITCFINYILKNSLFLTKVQLPNFFYIIATIIKAYWTALKTPFNWICFARVILNMMKLFLFFSCVEKQTNKKNVTAAAHCPNIADNTPIMHLSCKSGSIRTKDYSDYELSYVLISTQY